MALVPARKRGRNELARLHDEMDGLLGQFLGDWDWPVLGHTHWPAIDVAEKDNEFVVKVEVPGCKADDIDISVHGNMLTISGEKKAEEEKKEKGYYHMERSYGSFRRDLNLASEVDPAKIEAACKDGVLTITVPKSEKAKPVKVKVKGQ
ncbi:MAG: Hsp20/alpha crystallin family protein [Desulfobacterales bacterium]|jgi:HSP20 family protein|nr:Hsp20/alpha crystallin family protein [Desulfobacterales bacterium]